MTWFRQLLSVLAALVILAAFLFALWLATRSRDAEARAATAWRSDPCAPLPTEFSTTLICRRILAARTELDGAPR